MLEEYNLSVSSASEYNCCRMINRKISRFIFLTCFFYTDPTEKLYHVTYEDGDAEDLTERMVRDIVVSETLVEEIMKSADPVCNMKSASDDCIDLCSPVGDMREGVAVAANDDGATMTTAKSPRKTVFTDLEYSPQSWEKKKTMEEENKKKVAIEFHGMGKVVNDTGYI